MSRPQAFGPRRPRRAATTLIGAGLLAGALGAAGCGWETGPSAIEPETLVVMQDQHGEILGSRVFPRGSTAITLTVADAGDSLALSSKYIVISKEPQGGIIGDLVRKSDTGSVRLTPAVDGASVRATFMSTADLPERVMDCFYGNAWGVGFGSVRRIRPGEGMTLGTRNVTALSGDESVFTGAIETLNEALLDVHGMALGRLSWLPDDASAIAAGFSDPAAVGLVGMDWWWGVWYVLVCPRDPRPVQVKAALRGLICRDSCDPSPCGQDIVSYLVEPGSGDRLSRQGVSLLRFGAHLRSDSESFY